MVTCNDLCSTISTYPSLWFSKHIANFKGKILRLLISWYHFSSLLPLKGYFQKYIFD